MNKVLLAVVHLIILSIAAGFKLRISIISQAKLGIIDPFIEDGYVDWNAVCVRLMGFFNANQGYPGRWIFSHAYGEQPHYIQSIKNKGLIQFFIKSFEVLFRHKPPPPQGKVGGLCWNILIIKLISQNI